jgi:hypothetical protein
LIALVAIAALIVALVKMNLGDEGGNGNGGAQPTRTATRQAGLIFGTETLEEEPTRRVLEPAEPTATTEPEPTNEPEPDPTEEEEGGAPTIAPSDGGIAPRDPEPTETGASDDAEPISLAFSAEEWQGGFTRTSGDFLGRPWSAVYGATSGYGEATLTFALDDAPAGEAELTITGVDDEAGGDSPISVTVNGVEVFAGPSPFPSWEGEDTSSGPWAEVSFAVPAGVLDAGGNQITVANLDPSATIDSPPYVLLSDATLTGE